MQALVGQATGIPHVHVLPKFYIPQLNRHRHIWVYLPPSYAHSAQHYPVVYMMDGQNLFDPRAAYAGTWQIAQSMEHLHYKLGFPEAIIIGVENGGVDRIH
jgi:predicted alpha/beta superfamily hydrolase